MKNKHRLLLGIVKTAPLFMLFLLVLGVAAAPNEISLQGKLTDSSGVPQTGTYNFTFTIYNQSEEGANLYQIVNTTLTTDSSGVYDIILKNINISFEDPLYLGISVQGREEMTPRINLTSSPYAFYANTSASLDPNNTYQMQALNVLGAGDSYFIGNLGIGTVNPDDKLVVIGNINTTANLFVDGAIYGSIGAGNISGTLLDAQITNDITVQTTQDLTVGGGYDSGGITLHATGNDKGSGFFANDILIDGEIVSVYDVEINQSFLPTLDNFVTLGNASKRFNEAFILSLSGGNQTISLDSNVSITGNLTITSANLRVTGLNDADCDLKADTNGNFYCGTDATGSGGTTFNNENITGLHLNISSLNVTGDVVIESGNLSVGTQKENDTFTLEGGFYNIPPTPRLIAELELGLSLEEMYISGGYAYVGATSAEDIAIIDISVPSKPHLVSEIADVNTIAMHVAGSYAYITTSDGHFKIFDLTNITNPTLVSEISGLDGNDVAEVEVVGGNAYVVTRNDINAMYIIDVKNPYSPFIIGNVSLPDDGNALKISWPYAYVGTDSSGDDIEIYDISDPRNVPKIGGITTGGGGKEEIELRGGILYAGATNRIQIYNVTDPHSISLEAEYTLSNTPDDIEVVGRYLYSVGGTIGHDVHVIDVSDPANPTNVTSFEFGDSANEIEIVGRHMFMTSSNTNADFHVYDIGGIDTHAASIGSLDVDLLKVTGEVDFADNVIAQKALHVGGGGLMVQGPASFMNNTLNIDYRGSINITRGGLNITGGIRVSELNTADCDLKADTVGNLYCGTDATGGGSGGTSSAWNYTENFVVLNQTNLDVGIGMNEPSEKLVVLGNLSINATSDGESILFIDTTSGKVGIGTDSPTSNLTVIGDANITGSLYVNGEQIQETNRSIFYGFNGSENIPIKVTPDGRLDLSISETGQDDLNNGATGTDLTLTGNLVVDSPDNLFKVDTTADNVGINVSSPNRVLHVEGGFNLSSANRRIYTNQTCVVIEGPTSLAAFC